MCLLLSCMLGTDKQVWFCCLYCCLVRSEAEALLTPEAHAYHKCHESALLDCCIELNLLVVTEATRLLPSTVPQQQPLDMFCT